MSYKYWAAILSGRLLNGSHLFCGVMMILPLAALRTKLGLMLNEKIGKGKVVFTPKQVFEI